MVAALNVATAKARATAHTADELVVAADTLVVIDEDILGKPVDADEARGMLLRLRGREHHVLTGVCLSWRDLAWAGVVATRLIMRGYSDVEIGAYIDRGEPFDKAGAYAIQDPTFQPVERLDGCYLNVVGLPLCAVAAGLTAMDVPMAVAVERAGRPPCTYCDRGERLVRSGY